jgi:hypothetical protein
MTATDASTTVPRRHGWRWWGFRILRVCALAYLAVCVIVYSIQDNYVFPGAAATHNQKDGIVAPYYPRYLIELKSFKGVPIVALFGKALQANGLPLKDTSNRPTIIYCYGNGACMAYSTGVFEHFRRLGANVIIADYEGYGMSGGKPSETGCYAAADAEYDYLLTRKDIDAKYIVPVGWSLGAAVATDLASRRPVAGLVTISAFTNIAAMAHLFVKWLPMSFIIRYKFDNLDKFREIACPILIAHGTQDELIPYSMSGKLAAAAKGKVTRFPIEGAGHNDVFEVGGLELLTQIKSLLQEAVASSATTRPASR